MKKIDELYCENPCYGSRKYRFLLNKAGYAIGRKKVIHLMRLMGIMAIYQKPRTTIESMNHKKYPYLLKNISITAPNQVWTSDITYIPMERGFMYLAIIYDWFSRKVLSWKLSNTLDGSFCIESLNEAIERYGKPEIFNTDQGVQYTANNFIEVLAAHGIKISMDGKGRYLDNIMNERFWRTLKYEYIYLRSHSDGFELSSGLQSYIYYYNSKRPHQSHDYKTPDEIYFLKTLAPESKIEYNLSKSSLSTL